MKLDVPEIFEGFGGPSNDPNDWINLFNFKDQDSLASDTIMCAIYALQKHELIDSTQSLEKWFRDEKWRTKILSSDETEVKDAIAIAAEPFAQKLWQQSGTEIVATMPIEMIEWIRTTVSLILEGDLYREEPITEHVDDKPEFKCPIPYCPPCERPNCPGPKKVLKLIKEPAPPPNYVYAPHDVTVHNIINIDKTSNTLRCEPEDRVSHEVQDTWTFQDKAVDIDLGSKTLKIKTNANQTKIVMEEKIVEEEPEPVSSQKSIRSERTTPSSYSYSYARDSYAKTYTHQPTIWTYSSLKYKFTSSSSYQSTYQA